MNHPSICTRSHHGDMVLHIYEIIMNVAEVVVVGVKDYLLDAAATTPCSIS